MSASQQPVAKPPAGVWEVLAPIFNGLFEGFPIGVVVLKVPDFLPVLTNARAREYLEILPSDSADPQSMALVLDNGNWIPFKELSLFRSALDTGKTVSAEVSCRDRNGTERIIAMTSAPLIAPGLPEAVVATLLDRSSEQQLQDRLMKSQKMEMIGHLAGGMAHDFNNLLMAMLGHTGLILDEMDEAHEFRDSVCQIEKTIVQASEVSHQLLNLARKAPGRPKPTDMNQVLKETVELLRHCLPSSLEVSLATDAELKVVQADPVQLQQVIINLCLNARDAMPDGGKLHLETSRIRLDKKTRKKEHLKTGRWARLSVNDTGIGMDTRTLSHVFAPFFSTKPADKGTGLGLPMVKSILQRHGGFVEIDTAPGQGACISVYLPLAEKSQVHRTPDDTSEDLNGTETILLVDDRAEVLRLLSQYLEQNGYRVLTADNGMEALKQFRDESGKIALVVLDVTMPKMGGGMCYRELRKLKPEVNVIFATGYEVSDQLRELVSEGNASFVQKPIRPAELVREIRKLLDSDDS